MSNPDPQHLRPSREPAQTNPWRSGSFYLFGWVVVVATIVAAIVLLSRFGFSWQAGSIMAVVLIGALLAIGIIGAHQLKNDQHLTDAGYVRLMIESYKRLPLLRGTRSDDARRPRRR